MLAGQNIKSQCSTFAISREDFICRSSALGLYNSCRVILSLSSSAIQGKPASQASIQVLADSQRHLFTSVAYLFQCCTVGQYSALSNTCLCVFCSFGFTLTEMCDSFSPKGSVLLDSTLLTKASTLNANAVLVGLRGPH